MLLFRYSLVGSGNRVEVECHGVLSEGLRVRLESGWIDYITLCKEIDQPRDTSCRTLALGAYPPAKSLTPLQRGGLDLRSDFPPTPAVRGLRLGEEANYPKPLTRASGGGNLRFKLHC